MSLGSFLPDFISSSISVPGSILLFLLLIIPSIAAAVCALGLSLLLQRPVYGSHFSLTFDRISAIANAVLRELQRRRGREEKQRQKAGDPGR
jgi:hypothetical protein